MKLYIHLVSDEIDDCAIDIAQQLQELLAQRPESATPVELINHTPEAEIANWCVGLSTEVKRLRPLKSLFPQLQQLATEFKADWVIGCINPKTGQAADVCYFGHHEGEADLLEIGNYLNLSV